MGIATTIGGVTAITGGLWETKLSPRELRTLGTCNSGIGDVSVVLVESMSVSADRQTLSFPPTAATVLNIGRTDRTFIVEAGTGGLLQQLPIKLQSSSSAPSNFGGGDRQYLRALDELNADLKRTGEALLKEVRQHFPGDLRPVSARRFQETPDNFWFVTIQPRDQSLSITVRGLPERYPDTRLNVVVDRRPYSRFKVKNLSEVPDAVTVIRNAIRKGA